MQMVTGPQLLKQLKERIPVQRHSVSNSRELSGAAAMTGASAAVPRCRRSPALLLRPFFTGRSGMGRTACPQSLDWSLTTRSFPLLHAVDHGSFY